MIHYWYKFTFIIIIETWYRFSISVALFTSLQSFILSQMHLKLLSKFNTHRSETLFFFTLSNLSVKIEDFTIRVQLMNQKKIIIISYISVSNNLLSNLVSEHTSLSQIDFKLWIAVLMTDFKYMTSHWIKYFFTDHIAIVDSDWLFKTIISDA